jgi:hypothetical protein
MKIRWKFFMALAAGFVLVMGFYAAEFFLNLGVPTATSQWCSEIYEKKRLAAGKITSPKLFLVGGSGTLFGLSAREKPVSRPSISAVMPGWKPITF